VTYRLEAKGFPEGKQYTLWNKLSGEATPQVFLTGFVVDGLSGRILCPGASFPPSKQEVDQRMQKRQCPLPLDHLNLNAYRYHKGEPYEYALISTDQAVRGFAKTFPFPLEARDGSCQLHAERIYPSRAVAIEGKGFVPGEKVSTMSESSGEVLPSTETVSDEGELAVHIVDPGVIGRRGGTAQFRVVAKSCQLTLEYAWGSEDKIQ
jgi:hypothetical protein